MRFIITLFFIFWCSISFASIREIEVEFSFTNSGIDKANLFMDNVLICPDKPIIITGTNTDQGIPIYKFLCSSVELIAGSFDFDMTVMLFDEETPKSPKYHFTIELPRIENFIIKQVFVNQ